ncbi:MAG TPA: hypothetical protein DCZ41_03955 [Firmicutes bacterium]|nr:hypothetical protein [Bacillota bacterium]
MKTDENSMSSPEINYFRNYNISRLTGWAHLAYDHGVRKETRLLEKIGGFFFMKYEYTVLSENNYRILKQELNDYGRYGCKLVNVVWDNDSACLVAVMMRER